MSGLLGSLFSRIDATKRGLLDFVQNPVAGVQQMIGNANDRARGLNELTYAAAQEAKTGLLSGTSGYGPANQRLAQTISDAYNPMGIVSFNLGKNAIRPPKDFSSVLPDSNNAVKLMPHMASLPDNLDVSFFPVQGGGYGASYRPSSHLSKQKPFIAQGDDYEELLNAVTSKLSASARGAKAAESRKSNNSIEGMLRSEYGDVFDFKKSARSKSEYITHKPSGTKIRISDHNLPLAYEQADVNINSAMPIDEILKIIKNSI